MAYMNQELKQQLAPRIKAICKKHGVKASLAVRNHATLELNIKSGTIPFLQQYVGPAYGSDHVSVNPYHYHNQFTGAAKEFLEDVIHAMNDGNWDRSDISVDYFDTGWYVDVNIGRWNKPYILEQNT